MSTVCRRDSNLLAIIFILIRRLTASMNTSNSSAKVSVWLACRAPVQVLTKTPERTTNGIPESQQKADGRERFFATTESLCVLVPRTLSLCLIIRLHPQLKLAFLVIEKNLAVVAAV